MAPWRAAQRVAASVAAGRPVDAAAAISAAEAPDGDGPLRVIFVNRTRTKFSRSLTNLDALLQRCASARRSGGIGGRRVVCRRAVGAGSLRADVRAARGGGRAGGDARRRADERLLHAARRGARRGAAVQF